ncbi:NAD-dependent succinate-semialdehyde dehydrogenase [Thiomonas sp. FB-Cd]|uniref:NAD-dependent succinate-semialdehyde dehydrogenase n=1 Tax=Thiomonas sp. FB-Cd TaxID=1158292 RepID=UPI000B230D33
MQLASGLLLHALHDQTLLQARADDVWPWANPPQYRWVTNPANGDIIGRVPSPGACEASMVVNNASTAWLAWRRSSAQQRAALLRRWHDLVLIHADDLARIITSEQGKPLGEAHGEVIAGAAYLEWFAEEAKRTGGETRTGDSSAMRFITVRQPVGVCAAITPWNFPLSMITRKVAPALAAGCPVIVKPAEQTPLTALALRELAHRAGIPPGVFNVLTADAAESVAIGNMLCSHAAVQHISFTGSTKVGRALMRQVAPGRKRLALELGGHAPFIVFDDADFDAAIQGAMSNKFRNAGQTCVAANRLYVHDRIYDRFLVALVKATRQLKVGNGLERGVSFGPLMHEHALQKAERHVEDALNKGARLLIGGGRLTIGPHAHRFFQPTVLADATADMLCAREETFGPIAPVFRFQNEAEVLLAANATEYGLAAYLYSRDIGRITRMAEALEFGMVGINTGRLSSEAAPFGGIKQSGLGREGSRHGITEYLQWKTICLDPSSGGSGSANPGVPSSPASTAALA